MTRFVAFALGLAAFFVDDLLDLPPDPTKARWLFPGYVVLFLGLGLLFAMSCVEHRSIGKRLMSCLCYFALYFSFAFPVALCWYVFKMYLANKAFQ